VTHQIDINIKEHDYLIVIVIFCHRFIETLWWCNGFVQKGYNKSRRVALSNLVNNYYDEIAVCKKIAMWSAPSVTYFTAYQLSS